MTTTEIKSIKPAGGGGDYTSLNAWELAERANAYPTIPNGDLVSADKIKVAEVYGGGNASTGTTVDTLSGTWVTDPTHYIEIRAATGHQHNGVVDTGKAYFQSGTSYAAGFEKDTRIVRMQVLTTSGFSPIYTQNVSGHECTIDSCIARLTAAAGAARPCIWSYGAGLVFIKNCVLLTNVGTDTSNATVSMSASGSSIYNSTIIAGSASANCFSNAAGVVSQNNYLAARGGGACYGGGTPKGTNDATYNTEALTSTLRSIPFSTATFQVVTSGSENLRLVVSASNKLLDHGANLTAQGITTDIIGTARPQFGAFDIGAFENDIPVCWNYTAQYKNSTKIFKASGCGSFPKTLKVPSNVDISTGRMIDDGIFINPDEYKVV